MYIKILIIALFATISGFGQQKYIEYSSFDAAQTKLDYIATECKKVGIFDKNTTKLSDVKTDSTGTKFYVILDLQRTAGCDACYTQEDINNAKIVDEFVSFPNYEPEYNYVIFGTDEDYIKLIRSVPEMFNYVMGNNPDGKPLPQNQWNGYTLIYVNYVEDAHRQILEYYLGKGCVRNNKIN